jgi:glycosyltransferase involved in cell wall biosynthesis
MKSSKTLLILYSEVMPYNMACFQQLVNLFNIEIHLIQWKRKKLTPYVAEDLPGIITYDRESLSRDRLFSLAKDVSPDLIFVSGWMDKGYLRLCEYFKKRGVIVLCGLDNQWDSSIKQYLITLFRKRYVHRYFTHSFVPGIRQYEYARRIGFKPDCITLGAYTANTSLFNKPRVKNKIKKKILFVGRFNKVKGIDILINSFTSVIREHKELEDWELILIGNGPEKDNYIQSTNIKVLDFMSQEDVLKIVEDVDFFCLASRKEPWGVVIHEMAAAGLPLILSDTTGAGTEYLIDGYNGFQFKNQSESELRENLLKLMSSSLKELNIMGERSYKMSLNNSPEIWAYKVNRLLN